MTDPILSKRSSSTLTAAARSTDSSSIRPRNRRLVSDLDGVDYRSLSAPPNQNSGLLSALSPSNSRTASPFRSVSSSAPSNRESSGANLGAFLSDSWTQSWASVSGLASSLIASQDGPQRASRSQPGSRAGSRPGTLGRKSNPPRKGTGSWGPAPPEDKPGLRDIAAGSLAERESALKAARTASVLESHGGVNGGLNVAGKHKRRNSDEATVEQQPEVEDHLVYIHKVQKQDTYAGLILRYQCREDAFRKANGLWSRDSVQTRKYLTIPVDACEIRGRPCDPPSWHNSHGVDLLAPTPAVDDNYTHSQAPHDDFFSRQTNGASKLPEEDENPWTHVRWAKIDSFQEPVEIARVARKAMGYFPPRRRKSIRTISTFSTPRQSLDLTSNAPSSVDGGSSRRESTLAQFSALGQSSPSRGVSEVVDGIPAWMRRPGGVGSMGRHSRAPGPDKDVLNTWTKKHFPGLNNESLPSMAIMGSETARFGFKQESSGLVESQISEGQNLGSSSQQGIGLDKAAAAVETWLRGAIARTPSSQLLGKRAKSGGTGDLIELADTTSDDGKTPGGPPTTLMNSLSLGNSSSRSDGESGIRGRTIATGARGKKTD